MSFLSVLKNIGAAIQAVGPVVQPIIAIYQPVAASALSLVMNSIAKIEASMQGQSGVAKKTAAVATLTPELLLDVNALLAQTGHKLERVTPAVAAALSDSIDKSVALNNSITALVAAIDAAKTTA